MVTHDLPAVLPRCHAFTPVPEKLLPGDCTLAGSYHRRGRVLASLRVELFMDAYIVTVNAPHGSATFHLRGCDVPVRGDVDVVTACRAFAVVNLGL